MKISQRAPLALLLLCLLWAPWSAVSAAGASDNPHGAFAEDCTLCHSSTAWKPVEISRKFVHVKRFPLVQAHASVACRACHASLDFKQTRSACVDCHLDVHRGEFGLDCSVCHTTRNFIERAENTRRHRMTRFPLLGAHAPVDCSSCHRPTSSGQASYVNTPTECESCHLSDYNSAKNPDHVAGAFSRDCEQCHGTTSWHSASFNHDSTGFPLAGAHRTLQCTACHAGNQFAGTSPDCFACHQQDYDGTTNPSHLALHFSTNCSDCHNTTTWSGARFDHDASFFPIYSGTHAGRWSTCSTCHINSGNFADFSCFGCHPHSDKANTDSHHQGVSGYSYDSQACYSCHPRGTH